MKHFVLNIYLLFLLFGYGCSANRSDISKEQELIPIIKTALYDSTSVFFGDFGNYPGLHNAAPAPIGIFDSGTGGLTVMDAILTLDMFNNATGEEGPDGICDFAGESFIYLADQANMPYGNYSSEDKTDFLRELIVKDALFLMDHKVKSIVVACNTATATGFDDIELLLEKSHTGISALGVIYAGVQGALDKLGKDESGAIGLMATVGTIKTEGYERAIIAMAKESGYTGNIQIVNQPAMGFAEAVDQEPDFVSHTATQTRPDYRGPAIDHPEYPIDPKLLNAYQFDFSDNGMLYVGNTGSYSRLQLNAPQNYARYHLLSLIEKLRVLPNPQPLKILIMGCTHYPYYKDTLSNMLQELRNYNDNGVFPYRDLIADEVALVDPAIFTAKELYQYLKSKNLLAHNPTTTTANFYITVPNIDLPNVCVESPQRFTYQYKYGRTPGTSLEYVKTVPFSSENIDQETLNRFRLSIPATFSLITNIE